MHTKSLKQFLQLSVALITLLFAGACNLYAQINIENLTDCTEKITNPSFESGDMTGWTMIGDGMIVQEGHGDSYEMGAYPTIDGIGSRPTRNMSGSDGNYLCNYYSWNHTHNNPVEGIQQIIKDVDPGVYVVTAMLATWADRDRGDGVSYWEVKLEANDGVQVKDGAGDGTGKLFSVICHVGESGYLIIRASARKKSLAGGKDWEEAFFKADDFCLYKFNDASVISESLANPSFEFGANGTPGIVKAFSDNTSAANSGTASDYYLDIQKYATIDAAGWNTSLVDNIYRYTEDGANSVAWLTLPAYAAVVGAKYAADNSTFGSGNPQKWMETNLTSTSGSPYTGGATWSQTDVYNGSGIYFTSATVRAMGDNSTKGTTARTVTYYVTNTTEVKLYCKFANVTVYNNNYANRLQVYECTENSNGTLTASGTTSYEGTYRTKNGTGTINATGLSAAKIYKVVATVYRGYLYEIAFKTPLTPQPGQIYKWATSRSCDSGNNNGNTFFAVINSTDNGDNSNRCGSRLENNGFATPIHDGYCVLIRRGNEDGSQARALGSSTHSNTYSNGGGTITAQTTQKLQPGTYICTAYYKLVFVGSGSPTLKLTAKPVSGGTQGTFTGVETCNNLGLTNQDTKAYTVKGKWDDFAWGVLRTEFTITTESNVDISLYMYTNTDGAEADTDILGHYYAYDTEALIDHVEITRKSDKNSIIEYSTKSLDEYYLENQETHQWLCAGSAWDAHATADGTGIPVTLENGSETGKYYFATDLSNWGNNHLDVSLYCDGAPTDMQLQESQAHPGEYYILTTNGRLLATTEESTDYLKKELIVKRLATQDPSTRWKLWTFAERVADLQNGTEANPKDATFLVKGANFGRNDTRVNSTNWQGLWKSSKAINEDENFHTNGSGDWTKTNFNMQAKGGDFDLYQTITDVPDGVYTLKAQGLAAVSQAKFYAKDGSEEFGNCTMKEVPFDWKGSENDQAAASASFTNGLYDKTIGRIYVLDGKLTVGAKDEHYWTNQWACFDNFRLYYRPFVENDAKEEIGRGFTYCKNMVNIGDNAFQVKDNESHRQALKDAITTANAAPKSTSAQVRDNLKDLLPAIYAFEQLDPAEFVVNDPEDAFINVENNSDGYDNKGKVLTFLSTKAADLSSPESTSIGWTDAAGSIYPQTVHFTKVTGAGAPTNGYKMSYTRADGSVVYIGTKKTAYDTEDYTQLCSTTDASKALVVQIVSQTGTNGKWWLRNTEEGDGKLRISAKGKSDAALTTDGDYYDVGLYEAEEKSSASVSVSGTYHFSTLMLPFDATLPDGVVAYTVKGTLSDKTIALQEIGQEVKANVPYVLYSENGLSTTTLAGFGQAYTDDTQDNERLTGTFFEGQKVPVGGYVLSIKNYPDKGNVVAFYRVTTDNVSLPPYRAYYRQLDFVEEPNHAPVRRSVQGFTFINEELSPADIITLVNIILKKDKEEAPRFIRKANGKVVYTDMNGDGEVTLADVTTLVNMMKK